MSYYESIKSAVLVSIFYSAVYFVASFIAFYSLLKIAYVWVRSSAKSWTRYKRRELPPECLNDPVYGEHGYIQIKNIKLHYVQNGDKTKPLMLFLHGFPDFWYSWRYQMKHFSKHYWVVAVDLRGYGDSEKPVNVYEYKIKYLVSDVKNLITALGREKCILVSHDWGALIGYYFLFKYPEMVEKYVIINMYPVFATSFKWTQLIKSWYMFLFQLPYFPELLLEFKDLEIFDKVFKGFSHDDIEAYKFTFGKSGGFTHGINYYRANFLKIFLSYKKKPESVTFPKGLLIYTDNDRYIHISNLLETKDKIENLQLSFIKSGSHFLHQRKHEDTNKIMSKFLGLENYDDPGEGKSLQCDDNSPQKASS
ncbi:epoxide hydrolase 4-like [Planococcus citri]|uniref:epoxide hydrolase 4-like n=1 Tax=Planococcus citri TaxID=170843 RepID=UPI0031F8F0AA